MNRFFSGIILAFTMSTPAYQRCAVVVPVPANEPFVSVSNWPVGLTELLEEANRLGGKVGNESSFSYAGNATEFNEFISQLSRLEVDSLQLVIHAGS